MAEHTYSIDQAANVTVTTTSETVAATLSGIATDRPGVTIDLAGDVDITTGGSTTALVLRFREDSLTGTLIDEADTDNLYAAAGSPESHDIQATFTPTGTLSNKTIVLTIQQTGAVADGTVGHAHIVAHVLQ